MQFLAGNRRSEIPDSFEKILNRISKLKEAGLIESQFVGLINEQFDWFKNMREIRHLDVHRGAHTLTSVDEDSGRLLYQL